MGKYNLGEANIDLAKMLDKKKFYVNIKKTSKVEKDMEKQLEAMRVSLANINNLLNRSVKEEFVKGKRADAFKSWSKKAKSQSVNASKVLDKLNVKYEEDAREYPLRVLDNRIAELEAKLAKMSK